MLLVIEMALCRIESRKIVLRALMSIAAVITMPRKVTSEIVSISRIWKGRGKRAIC